MLLIFQRFLLYNNLFIFKALFQKWKGPEFSRFLFTYYKKLLIISSFLVPLRRPSKACLSISVEMARR